jgi:hypothetical protein
MADRFVDIFDAFGVPDGPVGVCVSCVRDRCGMQVNECANSVPCSTGLLCTLARCTAEAGASGPDLTCVLGCFMNDFSTALLATSSLACVSSQCGATCMPAGIGEGGIREASVSEDANNSVVPDDSSDSSNSVDTGDAADDGHSMDSPGAADETSAGD